MTNKVILAIALLVIFIINQPNAQELCLIDPVPGSCTIFAASWGETVLFGNNEDYNNPNTYIWVEPASEGNYGCLYVGFDNHNLQGGINEKGLAFDANALPAAELNQHPELAAAPNEWVAKTILKKAATVDQAIEVALQYQRDNWGLPLRYQIPLADANGDAVIIGAGPDGELAFTRKPAGDGYLVSTNFNRAMPKNSWPNSYPCWRYDKATEMLDQIKSEHDLTIDFFRAILDSVHVESANSNTLYSNIFDLKNGLLYLYHWHQFDEVVVLDVNKEIAEDRPYTRIKDLFSQETVKKAETEHQKYKEQQ